MREDTLCERLATVRSTLMRLQKAREDMDTLSSVMGLYPESDICRVFNDTIVTVEVKDGGAVCHTE
jgi:hypothetical protein